MYMYIYTLYIYVYIVFNTHKRTEAEKNNDRDGKVLYKLMNDTIYRKQWKT